MNSNSDQENPGTEPDRIPVKPLSGLVYKPCLGQYVTILPVRVSQRPWPCTAARPSEQKNAWLISTTTIHPGAGPRARYLFAPSLFRSFSLSQPTLSLSPLSLSRSLSLPLSLSPPSLSPLSLSLALSLSPHLPIPRAKMVCTWC